LGRAGGGIGGRFDRKRADCWHVGGRRYRCRIYRGTTSAGPHTDDLDLVLDGRDAQKYASQGQLRAIVLALKIAEIEHLTERLGDTPILLLDDVSSELDATRNAQLFDYIDQRPGQVFITTTDARHVRIAGPRRDFRMASGTIAEAAPPAS